MWMYVISMFTRMPKMFISMYLSSSLSSTHQAWDVHCWTWAHRPPISPYRPAVASVRSGLHQPSTPANCVPVQKKRNNIKFKNLEILTHGSDMSDYIALRGLYQTTIEIITGKIRDEHVEIILQVFISILV